MDLDVSNLEYFLLFLQAGAVEKNQNKYSKFNKSKWISCRGHNICCIFKERLKCVISGVLLQRQKLNVNYHVKRSSEKFQ